MTGARWSNSQIDVCTCCGLLYLRTPSEVIVLTEVEEQANIVASTLGFTTAVYECTPFTFVSNEDEDAFVSHLLKTAGSWLRPFLKIQGLTVGVDGYYLL